MAFATYQRLPHLIDDDRRVVAQLAHHRIAADAAVWDDATVDWAGYDAVVIRSCWDYHLRHAEFAAWLNRLAALTVPVWNPVSLVRWNMDKHYLLELQSRGVNVVPTMALQQGALIDLSALLESQSWDQAVVKPTVSATAYGTWRTSAATARQDQARFAELLGRSGILVQPFAEEVSAQGEWSLIFFHTGYSHAVLKRPQAGDFRVQEEWGGATRATTPPPTLIQQAEAILATIPEPWLFARVDGVDRAGTLMLMELELIEPSLYMEEAEDAPARFAEAIRAVVH